MGHRRNPLGSLPNKSGGRAEERRAGCVSCSADRTLRFFDFKFTKASGEPEVSGQRAGRSREEPGLGELGLAMGLRPWV